MRLLFFFAALGFAILGMSGVTLSLLNLIDDSQTGGWPLWQSLPMAAVGAGKATEADYAAISAANPSWNATLRTTCIPTLINGGHAPNAQPQSVTANVNCRIIPGEDVEAVRAKLAQVGGDEKVKVTLADPPAFAVAAGTLALLTEGCDRQMATCAGRFGNGVNFRGEPYLPGMDLLTRYPGA